MEGGLITLGQPPTTGVSGTPSTGNGSVTDIYTFTSVSGKDTSSIASDSGFTSTDGRFLNQLIYDSGTDTALTLRLATTATASRQLNFKANGATNPSITIQAGATGSVEIGGSTNGSVWIDANLTINHNGDGSLSITRPINGVSGAGITKTGTGALILSNANTYAGGTTISGGTITASNATALGSLSGQLTVNTRGTLSISGADIGVGNITGTGGIISAVSGTRTLTIGNGNNGGGNYAGSIQYFKEAFDAVPWEFIDPTTGYVMRGGAHYARHRLAQILIGLPGGAEAGRTDPKTTLKSAISGKDEDMYIFSGAFTPQTGLAGNWLKQVEVMPDQLGSIEQRKNERLAKIKKNEAEIEKLKVRHAAKQTKKRKANPSSRTKGFRHSLQDEIKPSYLTLIGYLDQEGQAILHVHNSEFLAFRIPFPGSGPH